MSADLLRAGCDVLARTGTSEDRALVQTFYAAEFGETLDGYFVPPNRGSAHTPQTEALRPKLLEFAAAAPRCAFPFPCERPAARDGLCVPHWSFTNKRGWAP